MDISSPQTDKRKNGHDDYNQTDQIDDTVHSFLPRLFRQLDCECRPLLRKEVAVVHKERGANKNDEHRSNEHAQ
jgi:hypothetical protein